MKQRSLDKQPRAQHPPRHVECKKSPGGEHDPILVLRVIREQFYFDPPRRITHEYKRCRFCGYARSRWDVVREETLEEQ